MIRIFKVNILLVTFCFAYSFAIAQQSNLLFKNGDRVCFVGNSITHNGEFHHNILQYYVTRFPKQRVSFYNAGIKGDVTGGILQRIDEDVMTNKPTHVVIMIGMNDVLRNLYKNAITKNIDTLTMRKNALKLYNQNLNKIVNIFLKKGVKVILQKPSPYDETSKIKVASGLGINNALFECGLIMQKLADKYKLATVDYWTLMTNLSKEMQEKNPMATLTVNDRVHPNTTGHMLMAYQFLKETNCPELVAKIVIDVKQLENKNFNANCIVKNAAYENNTLQATIIENALPFPNLDNQLQAFTLVPFMQNLNNEMLQIKNLNSGKYQLYIDSILIDVFTNDALQQGINLAKYKQTPQNKQALQVHKTLTALWEMEATLRTFAFVDFMHLKSFPKNKTWLETKKHLDSIYRTQFYGQQYYANSFEKYILQKPMANKLHQQADSLRKIIYKTAQPVMHVFSLKKVDEPSVNALIEASQSGAVPLLFNVQPNFALKEINDTTIENEFFVRNGLPNFFNKLKEKNPTLNIAFLGGSITKAEDQYRNQTLAFIQTLNPNATLKGINAGVSGTGTELGACRVNEQVLKYNPDLVFVEFAVNGGSNEAMEGIVRQIIKNNAKTDICFIYTIAGEQYKQYAINEIPQKIQAFEKIATHYNIPSIHMGFYPSILASKEKILWKSNAEVTDKIIFSKDGTHPTKAGGDLYAQAIAKAFKVLKAKDTIKTHKLISALNASNWEDGGMYSPQDAVLFSAGWENVNPLNNNNLKAFAPWFSTVSIATKPNTYFSFKFKGTAFGFFDIGGPEVGQVLVEIDGQCATLTRKAGNATNKTPNESNIKCLNNRFNSNCNNRYRGQFEMFEVSNGEHEVKITLSNLIADKLAILQGQDLKDIQQNPNKYNQQVFYLGKILVKGILLK